MRTTTSLAAIAALALALSSCSAPSGDEAAAQATGQEAQTAQAPLLAKAAVSRPWYAERFEALGFYAFDKPEPLGPIAVTRLRGGSASLADVAGKVTVLNFWATWCPPCRAEMPSIQRLYAATRDLPLDVMAISVGEKPDTVKAFIADQGFTFPVYLDPEGSASAPYVGRGIPTTYVLDKSGKAIAGVVGSHDYDDPKMVALFRELAERLP